METLWRRAVELQLRLALLERALAGTARERPEAPAEAAREDEGWSVAYA